jgi:AhpD family alkylhydroperoxidase
MRVKVTSQQIQEAFDLVKDDEAFAESVEAMKRGRLPGEMLRALALRPELLEGFVRISKAFYPGGIIPERRLKELVILEASRRNACQFCTNAHLAIARHAGAVAADEDALAILDEPERQTEREMVALDYTRAAMTDSNRIPQKLFDRLHELFSDAEIVELTYLIADINALNMFNNCLQITYHGEYDDLAAEKPRQREPETKH